MAGFQDPMAAFLHSKEVPDNYPLNLARTEVYQHRLESYVVRLKTDQFFDKKSRSLFMWDLVDSTQEFKPSPILKTIEDLSEYMNTIPKDPFWRFIFLSSPSARSPLGCSREQLQHLLTHHQVMPSFLEFIFTFKGRERPFSQAFFRHENYLEEEDPAFSLPVLGRSSMLIQHAFNVLSVEKSTDPGKSWPLRQTALYHAFDVRYGHSLWIVLKGDSLMRKRIPKVASQQPDMKPASMTTPERSLVACLHVHLIIMEWSAENWGDFVDYLEEKRTANAIDARLAPVTEMTSPTRIAWDFSRRGTIDTTVSKQSTFYGQESSTRRNSGLPVSPTSPAFKRSLSNLFRRGSDLQTVQENCLPGEQATEDATAGDADEDASNDFDLKFSFDRLQRLSLLGDELEQGIISIEQNKEVLAEIQAQYETVLKSPAFRAHVRLEECTGKISTFFRRLGSIQREMDMHLVRIKALSRAIDSDKVVFDAALQYKSARTSEYFAHSAKVSSDRMEDWTVKMHRIAVKTEQETISMHVITIFTLIFLPGTFLATFFSSGVLNWNDEGLLDSDWVLRSEALKLFLFICVPLMIVIIAGWSLMYIVVRRKRKATERAIPDGYADEKGMNHGSSAGLGILGQPERLPSS